jgi:hypothetical protein
MRVAHSSLRRPTVIGQIGDISRDPLRPMSPRLSLPEVLQKNYVSIYRIRLHV